MNEYREKIIGIWPHIQETFTLFAAMIAAFGFPTSARYNALHGPIALCGILASMAFTRSCGNNASKLLMLRVFDKVGIGTFGSLHLPTSQWVLKMFASLDHDPMERACRAAFHACIVAARARGMIPARPLGMIDAHGSAYYGKNGDKKFVIKSKKKDGTTTFDMFLASAIRAGWYTLHTGMRRMCAGVPIAEYLGDLLEQNREEGVVCSHWLVDRQFFNVGAMCEFGKADEYFLMYASMTPGVKKALGEYKEGKRADVSEYIVKSSRAKFVGTLAFVKKNELQKDGTYKEVIVPFFSNLPRHLLKKALRDLPIEMKKRWAHETSLRVAKMSKPMTTSNNPSIRTCLFGVSLLFENLWAMSDHVAGIKGCAGGRDPPCPQPPADDELGDARCLAETTKYNLTSKEFLSMVVSEASRLLTMDKQSQDEYVKGAVAKNRHLISPMIPKRQIITGADASGIPHWC